MPYVDSPGWERQWADFAWKWDFHVTTVSEGHRVVGEPDKQDAKSKGAKLTFGEVLDAGVGRMLHNLGADHKTSFHDLGMGPGKMLVQAYLQYPNFRRSMGVELAKGRYDLAEKNLRALLRLGWRGRTFMGIEFKKGSFMKIVELTPNHVPKNGWQIGDECIAYNPKLKNERMQIKDYSATIVSITDDNKFCDVKYKDGTEEKRILVRYLFVPGTERTCEIWYGSLFDYPNGFDADMCILETDFPENMHPHLIECMCTTPIGCTFLTYHDLKKFKCYNWKGLRQVDVNVYDSDRYLTSWSQGWRFYLWEHIDSKFTPFRPLPQGAAVEELPVNTGIVWCPKDDESTKCYGEVIGVDTNTSELRLRIVKGEKAEASLAEISLDYSSEKFTFYLANHRHKLNQPITAYFPEHAAKSDDDNRFFMARGTVLSINPDSLSYNIRYDEYANEFRSAVVESYVYKAPNCLFNVGDRVMACWPRNAQNKNCPERYKKFPGTILGVNSECLYHIQFDTDPYTLSLLRSSNPDTNADTGPTPQRPSSEFVREMWITFPAHFVRAEESQLNSVINANLSYNDGSDEKESSGDVEQKQWLAEEIFYDRYPPNQSSKWTNAHVLQWLQYLGLKRLVSMAKEVNLIGTELLEFNTDELQLFATDISNLVTKKSKVELKLSILEQRNLMSNVKYLKQCTQRGSAKGSHIETQRNSEQLMQIFNNQLLQSRQPTNNSTFVDTDRKE